MNKKELNELRRNFSESSDLFTLNHVVTAFRCREGNSLPEFLCFHNIPQKRANVLCVP